MRRFDDIIDNLIQWDATSDKLYAAVIVGSQARQDHHADENSDLDLMLFVDDPEEFMLSDQWVNCLGNPRVAFAEDTMAGGKEKRVLFDGALDVDFIFLSKDILSKISGNGDLAFMLKRGYRIVIDKIGVERFLPQVHQARPSYAFPTEREFLNLVNDFWFHTVWVAKKIKRGELWTAKYCVDNYMKSKLLWMTECHAHAANGSEYDTWHNGRFLEEWAEDRVVKKLPYCFAHYNKHDVKSALIATMDLFRLLAVEAAQKLRYEYPKEADEYTTNWVMAVLQI